MLLVSARPNYADESLNMLITVLATKHYFTDTICSNTRIENYFFLLQWSWTLIMHMIQNTSFEHHAKQFKINLSYPICWYLLCTLKQNSIYSMLCFRLLLLDHLRFLFKQSFAFLEYDKWYKGLKSFKNLGFTWYFEGEVFYV